MRDVVVELGPVAGLGVVRERAEPGELLVESRADRLLEERIGRGRGAQLGAAEIVGAALQQRERERHRAVLVQRRQVLGDELALERDRRGGDDDLEARRNGRREVREALSRAGRRLGNEMVSGAHRLGDRSHEELLSVALLAFHPRDRRAEQLQRIGPPGDGRAYSHCANLGKVHRTHAPRLRSGYLAVPY